jgi:hypothetical protein
MAKIGGISSTSSRSKSWSEPNPPNRFHSTGSWPTTNFGWKRTERKFSGQLWSPFWIWENGMKVPTTGPPTRAFCTVTARTAPETGSTKNPPSLKSTSAFPVQTSFTMSSEPNRVVGEET